MWELEDTLFSLFIGVVSGLIMTMVYVISTASLTWVAFLFMLAIGIAIGFALVANIQYGSEGFVTLWTWVEREGKPLWIKTKASYNWMMRDPDLNIPAKRKTKKKVTKKKAKKKVTKKKTKKIKRK